MASLTLKNLTEFLGAWLLKTVPNIQAPTIVAIDGPDCAGKTTLARALVTHLKSKMDVAVAHFDDYLNSAETLARAGLWSVEAFLNDYFDASGLVSGVLRPALRAKQIWLNDPHMLIVEGLFLFRPPLIDYFDVKVRLEVSEQLVMRRALQRDVGRIGTEDWVERHYREQCIPAQRLYRAAMQGFDFADFVISVDGDDSYDIIRFRDHSST